MADPQDDTYGDYSVDGEDQPHGDGDSQSGDRGLKDPLEEGYSPPEKWSAAQGFGNTPQEAIEGETLEQRIAQEEPEPDPYLRAEQEPDLLDDGEVGSKRAGRISASGEDVGIDGAGASAEEAAMHVVDEHEDEADLTP